MRCCWVVYGWVVVLQRILNWLRFITTVCFRISLPAGLDLDLTLDLQYGDTPTQYALFKPRRHRGYQATPSNDQTNALPGTARKETKIIEEERCVYLFFVCWRPNVVSSRSSLEI